MFHGVTNDFLRRSMSIGHPRDIRLAGLRRRTLQWHPAAGPAFRLPDQWRDPRPRRWGVSAVVSRTATASSIFVTESTIKSFSNNEKTSFSPFAAVIYPDSELTPVNDPVLAWRLSAAGVPIIRLRNVPPIARSRLPATGSAWYQDGNHGRVLALTSRAASCPAVTTSILDSPDPSTVLPRLMDRTGVPRIRESPATDEHAWFLQRTSSDPCSGLAHAPAGYRAPVPSISSPKDDHIALIRTLATRANRMELGRAVIEGESLIEQALTAGVRLEFILTEPGSALAEQAARTDVPTLTATPALLRQALRTQRPVGAIAVVMLPPENDPTREYGDFALLLDRVADPGNLGTIIRTACGLGATDIVCTDPDTDLSSRRVLDTSRCAVLSATVRRFDTPLDAVKSLRTKGFEVITTSPHGQELQSLVPLSGAPVALVIGNETEGSSEDVLAAADHVVRIPMAGGIESLNVGVAAGLSIYELRLRMVLASLADRARATLDMRLGAVSERFRDELDRALADTDHLTGIEMGLLTTVVAGTGTPPWLAEESAEIARKSLVAKGFITEESAVTDLGRQVLAALWSAHGQTEDTMLAGLSEEERRQLTALLDTIARRERE